jgi:hypothetical protein
MTTPAMPISREATRAVNPQQKEARFGDAGIGGSFPPTF